MNGQIGFSPNHIFDGTLEGENIDVLTGNVNIRFPLGPRYSLASDFGYQVELYYNSKIWEHECNADPQDPCPGEIVVTDNYGLGFNILFAKIYQHPEDKPDVYRLQLADGGEHFFQDIGQSTTIDNATIRVDRNFCFQSSCTVGGNACTSSSQCPDSWAVYPGDGAKILLEYEINADRANSGWYATRIETVARQASPPGTQPQHYIEIHYVNEGDPVLASSKIDYILDSAGRQIEFTYPGHPFETMVTLDFPAFSADDAEGTSRAVYTLFKQNTPIEDPSDDPAADVNRNLLTRIEYPLLDASEQEYHEFGYDPEIGTSNHGYLLYWDLPTGAEVDYIYRHYGTGARKPYYTELVAKTITMAGDPQSPYRWSYSRFGDGVARTWEEWLAIATEDVPPMNASNPLAVHVMDPFNNLTSYRFKRSVYFSSECNSEGQCSGEWDDGLLDSVAYYVGPTASGDRLVKYESYTHTNSGLFEFRTPVAGGGVDAFKIGRRVRTEEVLTQIPAGSGLFPGDHRVEHQGWNGPLPVQSTEYGPTLYRTTYRDYEYDDKYRRAHRFTEMRGTNGAPVSRTDKKFTNGRVECEVRRITPTTGVDDLSCQQLASTPGNVLQEGDVGIVRTFDPENGRLTQKDVLGKGGVLRTTVYGYSPAGHLATKRYYDFHSLPVPFPFPWLAAELTVDYNTGLVYMSRDPAQIATQYSWDVLGRLTAITPALPEEPVTIVYEDLRTTRVQQGSAYLESTETIYHYDELGRLVREERKAFDDVEAAPKYDFRETEYDIAGRVVRQSEWAEQGTTNLAWTAYEYTLPNPNPLPGEPTTYTDPLGRISKVTRPDGSTTETSYDGLATTVKVLGIEGIGGPIDSETEYVNDVFGRLVQVDSPGGGADAVYAYDERDNLVSVALTDPTAGVQTRGFDFDALGRLRSATHPESGTVEYLEYDAAGKLLRYRDASGSEFRNTYDGAGRLLQKELLVDAVAGTYEVLVENVYDESPDHQQGDGAGKLVKQKSYKQGDASPFFERRLSYGGSSSTPCSPALQNKASYEGLNGRLAWTSVIFADTPQDPVEPGLKTDYCYDGYGRLYRTRYPAVNGSTRTRTQIGQIYQHGFLWGVHDLGRPPGDPEGQEYLDVLEYDPAGAPLVFDRGNEVTTTIERDAQSRPLSYAVKAPPQSEARLPLPMVYMCRTGPGPVQVAHCPHPNPGPTPGPNLVDWESGDYLYDGAGNITEIGTQSYWYDELNRLVLAGIGFQGSNYDLVYQYDGFGNMTRKKKWINGTLTEDRDFAIQNVTNRLESSDEFGITTEYDYDADGNLTTNASSGYVYDAQNRLTELWQATDGLVATYDYDASGYRVRTVVDGYETFYVRDLSGRVLSEFRREVGDTGSPVWDKDYVYALGQPLTLINNLSPSKPPEAWVTSVTDTGLVLHWDSVDDPDIDVYNITIEESSSSVKRTAKVFPPQTTYVDSYSFTCPPDDVWVSYHVEAQDTAGNTSPDAVVLVEPCDDTTPPTPVLDLAVPLDRAVHLTWTTDSTGVIDLAGHLIYRDDQQIAGPIEGGEYLDFGLTNDTSYSYHVRSVDTSGNESADSNTLLATPTDNVPPPIPQGVVAEPWYDEGEIRVRWQAVTDIDEDLAGYAVYRSTGTVAPDYDQPLVSVAPPNVSVVDLGPLYDLHYYWVRSYDVSGNYSQPSQMVSARPRTDITEPALQSAVFDIDTAEMVYDPVNGLGCTCANLCAEDDDVIQVKLTWTDVSAEGYRVYRAVADSEEYVLLATLDDDVTEYLDIEPGGHDFTYYVVAVDLHHVYPTEESAASNRIRATDLFDTSVRQVVAYDGRGLYDTDNKESRSVTVYWSNLPESQLAGYHVYRRCDWRSGEELAAPYLEQTEFCSDSWVRLTSEPAVLRVFHDDSVGGLQGSFVYAVRAVALDGTEGPMETTISIELGAGISEYSSVSNPRCDEDMGTLDIYKFPQLPLGPGTSGYEAVTINPEVELARVNDTPRGTGSPDGAPPAPESPTLTFRTMPAYQDSPSCSQPPWTYDTVICKEGIFLDEGLVRYAEITWGPASGDRPSDLVGYHVEMAGSASGPWRRITVNPVAWWEQQYRAQGLGVLRNDAPDRDDNGEPNYSGHLDCLHFRVIAVDADGNESPPSPAYPDPLPDPAVCPQTPPAPQNLRASDCVPQIPHPNEECDASACETRLEWDPSPGAVVYYIYRYVFQLEPYFGGVFFYQTHKQLAVGGPVETYIEKGDLNVRDNDRNEDCPAVVWAWGTQGEDPCGTGKLEAYYVTARGATGGESPRSNIVFWQCDADPSYAYLQQSDSEYDLFASLPQSDAVGGELAFCSTEGPGEGLYVSEEWLVEANLTSSDMASPGHEASSQYGPPHDPTIAPLLILGQSSEPEWEILDLHVDHLGSVRVVTDENGEVVSQHDYFPFGGEIMPMLDHGTKMFTGHERDRESGLDYMMARYYGASFGRFSSPDPIEGDSSSPSSWNRFSYVRNSPVSFSDPTGECADPGGHGIRVCISSFIPGKSFGGFDGDNRGPNPNGGTFRVQHTMNITPRSKKGLLNSEFTPGVSSFGPFRREAAVGTNDVSPTPNGIRARAEASDGLLFGASFDLTYDITLVPDESRPGGLRATGSHTAFPSLEIWLYPEGGEPILIYEHDASGTDFVGGLIDINRTITIEEDAPGEGWSTVDPSTSSDPIPGQVLTIFVDGVRQNMPR